MTIFSRRTLSVRDFNICEQIFQFPIFLQITNLFLQKSPLQTGIAKIQVKRDPRPTGSLLEIPNIIFRIIEETAPVAQIDDPV